MYIVTPPGIPPSLKVAIGVLGGHLVFDTIEDAKEGIRLINPEYASAHSIINLKDIQTNDPI
jgi:hypothetical protein